KPAGRALSDSALRFAPWRDRLIGTYLDQPHGGLEGMTIGIHGHDVPLRARAPRIEQEPGCRSAKQSSLQFLHCDWLREVYVESGRRAATTVRALPVSGQCDELYGTVDPPDLGSHVIAVHARQSNVQENDFGAKRQHLLDRFVSRVNSPRLMAFHLQKGRQRVGRVLVVIHHENTTRGACPLAHDRWLVRLV